MMQSSLAGVPRPLERRREEFKNEHQQLRREVGRMHEAHTKDSMAAFPGAPLGDSWVRHSPADGSFGGIFFDDGRALF